MKKSRNCTKTGRKPKSKVETPKTEPKSNVIIEGTEIQWQEHPLQLFHKGPTIVGSVSVDLNASIRILPGALPDLIKFLDKHCPEDNEMKKQFLITNLRNIVVNFKYSDTLIKMQNT